MGYNTRSKKTSSTTTVDTSNTKKPKVNKSTSQPPPVASKYSSKVIFDGVKSNKHYYTKQVVYEKTNETPTKLLELGEIAKAFSKKMKAEDPNNKVSVIGYTPLGWKTFISFDNSLLMNEADYDDYFQGKVVANNQEKFTEVSQFILCVNKPIVSKSKVVKMKK
jgi:hypothetical protein